MPARFAVRATPGAARDQICRWANGELWVKVRAPAVDGKANDALCRFLAETLGVPTRAVSIIRGETARHKLVEVAGLDPAMVEKSLTANLR